MPIKYAKNAAKLKLLLGYICAVFFLLSLFMTFFVTFVMPSVARKQSGISTNNIRPPSKKKIRKFIISEFSYYRNYVASAKTGQKGVRKLVRQYLNFWLNMKSIHLCFT